MVVLVEHEEETPLLREFQATIFRFQRLCFAFSGQYEPLTLAKSCLTYTEEGSSVWQDERIDIQGTVTPASSLGNTW